MESVFDWSRWQRHFPSVEVARRWYESVPDPLTAADWYFIGVRDPVEAAEWVRLKKTPQVIRVWRDAGVMDVSVILAWIRMGQSLDDVSRWVEIGFATPEMAAPWISLGQTPTMVTEWFRLEVKSPNELASLLDEGVSLALVKDLDVKTPPPEGWRRWAHLTTQGAPAKPTIVNKWLVARESIVDAAPWVDVGATPFFRDILTGNGIFLEALQRLRSSDCSGLATSVLSHQIDHIYLAKWIEQGFTLDGMMPFVLRGVSLSDVLDWQKTSLTESLALWYEGLGFSPANVLNDPQDPRIAVANLKRWEQAGLPPRSVKLFVFGGIPDPETALKWLQGFENNPQRAIDQFHAFAGDFRRARAAVRRIERAMHTPIVREILPQVRSSDGFDRPSHKFPFVSEDWLEEILAWARTLQSSLRKSSQYPSTVYFDQLELEVKIEYLNDAIHGSVVAGTESFTCAFDPETFDPVSAPITSAQRFTLGICLCWFIDCSIVIRRPGYESSDLFRAVNDSSKRSTKGVRYMPTPTFDTRQSVRLTEEAESLKVRHLVSGHIRTLPAGHHGSEHARQTAPKHIRKVMRANETYVQPHFRGTEEQRQLLEIRLSHYSALGEALSDLSWR